MARERAEAKKWAEGVRSTRCRWETEATDLDFGSPFSRPHHLQSLSPFLSLPIEELDGV